VARMTPRAAPPAPAPLDEQAVAIDAQHAALDLGGGEGGRWDR
jgi:hypothetical protein